MAERPAVETVGRKVRLISPQAKTKVVLVHRSADPVEVKLRPIQPTTPRVVPLIKRPEPTASSDVVYEAASTSSSATAILEIPSLGDELLNGSDTSSKEVVINGRTYSIQNIAGQHMFVDVLTQQKLLPVQRGGELTLIDVLEEQVDEADINKEIEPEDFMDMETNATHIDVIRPSPEMHDSPSPSGISTDGSFGQKTKEFVHCQFCQATFSKRSNFYRHLRRAHETDSNQFRVKPQGDKGKCPQCESRFFSRHELLLHLAHKHQQEVVLFNLTFTTKESYNRWLEDVKVQYTTSYVAHNGGRKSLDGRIGRIYHCSHEFMSYKMRQAETTDRNELTMRSRRSVANKVAYCTAHIRVFTDEKGILYVTGSPTHINHEIDPDNLSGARVNLPSSETLPGYRNVFRNCSDGLPSQTKTTIHSLVAKAEELKAFLQHKPVSENVLMAIQRTLSSIYRVVSTYKCRVVVSDASVEDQSAQAAIKWAKES